MLCRSVASAAISSSSFSSSFSATFSAAVAAARARFFHVVARPQRIHQDDV
jgi:hypothetical protein